MKNLIIASCFNFIKTGIEVPITALMKVLGTTHNQIVHAIKKAKSLIDCSSVITAIERKQRKKDKIIDKIDPYLYDFFCDTDISRLDAKQHLCVIDDPKSPGNEIQVHKRIWLVGNKEQLFNRFLQSEYNQELQHALGRNARMGRTLFQLVRDKICTFITNPKPESCVDPLTSGLEHCMRAMLTVMMDKQAKSMLGQYVAGPGELSPDEFEDILRSAGYVRLVESCCCEKVEQPTLCHVKRNKKRTPKLIPFKCTHGDSWKGDNKCNLCGAKQRLRMLDHLKHNLPEVLEERVIDVFVWKDVERQGKKKNGKQNMQKELTQVSMSIPDRIDNFIMKLEECIPRHANIRWFKLMFDIQLSEIEDSVLHISTDFAATMNLRASETLNCATDGHAVVCNFVCLHHRRVVPVKRKNKDCDEFIEEVAIHIVDVHHAMAGSNSPGKKADHAMHNATLEAIIGYYKPIFLEINPEKPLKHVIVHTDNCPSQYRCRHTILHTTMAEDRTGVKIQNLPLLRCVVQLQGSTRCCWERCYIVRGKP